MNKNKTKNLAKKPLTLQKASNWKVSRKIYDKYFKNTVSYQL